MSVPPVPLLLEVVQIATAAVVGSSVFKGLWDAVQGMRAKNRAKIAIKSSSNKELTKIAMEMKLRKLSDAEIDLAAQSIRSTLINLSSKELKLVEQGLNQSNKSGERRYVQELISPLEAGTLTQPETQNRAVAG